jgi:hypothetical protein
MKRCKSSGVFSHLCGDCFRIPSELMVCLVSQCEDAPRVRHDIAKSRIQKIKLTTPHDTFTPIYSLTNVNYNENHNVCTANKLKRVAQRL